MVLILPASRCNCKVCNGGFPARNGAFGGSSCACECHEKKKLNPAQVEVKDR